MKSSQSQSSWIFAWSLALLWVSWPAASIWQPAEAGTANMGDNDLSGSVSSLNGPEAGVWVIAETGDLPTKFVKIVVTDDGGRYLIPDLPKANYRVWVRGYRLIDSPKIE